MLNLINYYFMKKLIILLTVLNFSCSFQANKNSNISNTKNIVEHKIAEKQETNSIRTLYCGKYICEIANGLIKIYLNNNLLREYNASTVFYDKNSSKLIFSLKDENRLIFLSLKDIDTEINFELDEKEILINAFKLKNERYFVLLQNNESNESIYEIEADLERLELVEGKMSNFKYSKLEPIKD